MDIEDIDTIEYRLSRGSDSDSDSDSDNDNDNVEK